MWRVVLVAGFVSVAGYAGVDLSLRGAKRVSIHSNRLVSLVSQNFSGVEDEVRRILRAGADPNNMMNPLFRAISSCKIYYQDSNLATDSKGYRLKIVEILLQHGADPNSNRWNNDMGYNQADEGLFPLHIAARTNNPSVVELLLKYDADPNILDSEGKTPLTHAEGYGDEETVRLLTEHVADPDL